MQTEPYDQSRGSWISIASTEGQLVVQLKEVWQPNGLPAAQEARCDLPVFFAPLSLDIDLMAVDIHQVE